MIKKLFDLLRREKKEDLKIIIHHTPTYIIHTDEKGNTTYYYKGQIKNYDKLKKII